MVTIKEFIKENSITDVTRKKKRLRLKNFNPFRKRKYKTLNEDVQDDFHQDPRTPLDDNQNLERIDNPVKGTDDQAAAKRQYRLKELYLSAKDRLGLSKGNLDDLNAEGRKKDRKQGSIECLIDVAELADDCDDVVIADPKCGSVSGCDADNSEKENVGTNRPIVKRVVISEEIEVIETVIDVQPKKKKKKSKKKKLKKAGIKTAKLLGQGLTNMAISLRYLTPDAAIYIAPAVMEISRRQEERYRELSSMAYALS